MEFVIGAASWALGKALASAKDTLAERWAASKGIGDNFDALEMELLHAQWILDHPHVKQSRSPPITELLVKLRQVAYDADDVLDELDYYRIQDDLDGTQHATNVDDDGGGLLLHARSTANAIGKRLTCCSFPSAYGDPRTRVLEEDSNMPSNGRRFFSCAWSSRVQHREYDLQAPKLKFDRVDMSTKMKNIVDKLKPLCAKLTTILDTELLGSANPTSTIWQARNRPAVSDETIEQRLFGRDDEKYSILDKIDKEYSRNLLTVLPVVGPGGIGKTTLIKHIYEEVKSCFHVSIWICVSINFNADRLAEEIAKKIPRVIGERETASVQEVIEQQLKFKRFLLVLDDVWTCKEAEWLKLLAPFRKVVGIGSMIIVTTRIPSVANMVNTVFPIHLERLVGQAFMDFFSACVFGHHHDGEPWKEYGYLRDVGEEIVKKLKGFPPAAKTVGKLLGNQLTLKHWRSVLESSEWEQTSGEHDIMPALKLSYDYLPFHLQQCFSYLAMFPEDYEFGREELIYLWMGLDILNSHDENKRPEDIGQSYLIDLVNHEFLKAYYESDHSSSYYVVHDLIHELAMKVQSKECIRICSSKVMSTQITPSVRHLSIIVDETDVKDRVSFERFKNDLRTLDRRLKIQNLRTLMLFGKHHGSFAKTFDDLFRNARALRTIFLQGASYAVEDILYNFSKLVHLRYLKIESLYNEGICIPSLCRLYHLQMVDLHGWKGQLGSTRSVSKLGNLRHFLVPDDAMPSGIFEVGKLKSLQELKRFVVKNESQGFELGQLGDLVELGGSLQISNLERVEGEEEAGEAKLSQKKYLHKLIMDWDSNRSNKDSTEEDQVLEGLMPSSNLRELCISGHGGTDCPSWLGADISNRHFELLQLHDLSWKNLPPLGELWLVDEHGEECQSYAQGDSFKYLRRLELVKIPNFKRWAANDPPELSFLEILIIKDCPQLIELPFRQDTECGPGHKDHTTWFPMLQELEIVDCPKLSSLPRIPWTPSVCYVKIEQVDSSFEQLLYRKHRSECCLEIKGRDTTADTAFWMVLAFENLTEVQVLEMKRCPPVSMDHLGMLSSLRTLKVHDSSNAFWFTEADDGVRCQFQIPIEHLTIQQWGVSGEQLTHLWSCMPKLCSLNMGKCEELTELGVADQQKETEAPAQPPSDSVEELEDTQIVVHQPQHQHDAGAEEEILAPPQGLLLLPPQLESLRISNCPNLELCPVSLDAGTGEGGGGLQGLSSLRSMKIQDCPRFLSSSSLCFPFPTSLEEVSLHGAVGTATLLPLSNLTTLTDLSIKECGDLRGEGLWPLLAHGHLTKLSVSGTPNFFAGYQPSSSKLQKLWTDDVAGVLVAPICRLLYSSLTELYFWGNQEVHRFTMEQEEALQLLTSLEEIRFWECHKLRGLPGQLHRLPNLKRLYIGGCTAIQSLHKDGLPGSLQELVIKNCPAIRSLPKVDDLPSSLLVLDVQHCNSKRLRRQCRKLIGTIPIVRV